MTAITSSTGAARAQAGTTANDFRYTGQQDDRNANRGLYYLRAQAYDPALGRFISRDPLPGMNRYAYVDSNPTNFTDFTGLCAENDPQRYAHPAASSTPVPSPQQLPSDRGSEKETLHRAPYDACSPLSAFPRTGPSDLLKRLYAKAIDSLSNQCLQGIGQGALLVAILQGPVTGVIGAAVLSGPVGAAATGLAYGVILAPQAERLRGLGNGSIRDIKSGCR